MHLPGSRSTRPITVEITDETGKPVAGAAVSFHLPEDGPGGTFVNGLRTEVVITDARGRASLHGLLANRIPGRFQIRILASKEQARAGTVSFQYVAEPRGGAAAAVCASGGPQEVDRGGGRGGGRRGGRPRGHARRCGEPGGGGSERAGPPALRPSERPPSRWVSHEAAQPGQRLCLIAGASCWRRPRTRSSTSFWWMGARSGAAPAVYDFGSLYAGESASAHFRLRNISSAPATLNDPDGRRRGFHADVARASGRACPAGRDRSDASSSAPPIPEPTAPRCIPTASPSCSPRPSRRVSPTVSIVPGRRFPVRWISAASCAAPGAERRITFRNDTPLVLTVPAISVQGADFALLAAAALRPGARNRGRAGNSPSCSRRRPPARGRGRSRIGDRSYPLLGTGVDPPLPKPTVVTRPQAGGQRPAGHADRPLRRSGADQRDRHRDVWISTVPPTPPSLSPSGGRSVTFPIAPGDIQAVLPFQTGTTAGVLTFTAQVGDASDQQSVTIAAAPPGISTAQAVRSAGRRGDPRHRLRQHAHRSERSPSRFTMPPASRSRPGPYAPTPPSDFASYFAGSDLGGVFLLRAVFPVTGDASAVASCEATLANSAGSAKTQRILLTYL